MAKRKGSDTPLMRQYLDIKSRHPDAVLFFRLGDFYEMFFEDAVIAANALDLTLTTRDKNSDDPIPMCGVPHHAGRGYIARMTEQGHKVVLCEQTEDPKKAKGLVKREVVRIITPGVVLDEEVLDPKAARYVAALAAGKGEGGAWVYGLAYLDVSTGEFRATEIGDPDDLIGELVRVAPREILAAAGDLEPGGPIDAIAERFRGAAYTAVEPHGREQARELLEGALAGTLAHLGLGELPLATRAAADVVAYARDTQPAGTLPLTRIQVYAPGEAVVLDEAAVANLELTETLIGGKKAGSLLSVIDATVTAPGGRLLRRWLLYPLTEVAPVRRRQDAVEHLVSRASLRAAVREELRHVYDLERLAGRASLGLATPRDLGRLRDSLLRLPALAALVAGEGEPDAAGSPGAATPGAATIDVGAIDVPELLRFDPAELEVLAELAARLDEAVVDAPPPVASGGGIIRDGYCAVVDENRALASGGKDKVAAIERRERERTGIPSLKVKYNKVFGYYIEVTRTHLDRVPDEYVRKQTIANGERYVTGELADLEAKILGAEEALVAREHELFADIVGWARERARAITDAGARVATVDACAGLAEIAHTRGYVRPTVDDSDVLDIAEGRHPVVEQTASAGSFVPNDCRLDPAREQVLLVTGPNMAGKSTYMRQVAQIALLAQMGSFVPAARARVGIVDRIFTRVGAADNLARGDSTFMVEMRETATILRGATRRSLVVLDEVGRGTSTFDGVAIAWAVTEFLHDAVGCKTLFATHYHELCALAESRPRVVNLQVAVREHAGEIVFLRQVVPGGADKSYGVDVARLAGLPRSVVSRARQIMAELEQGGSLGRSSQLALFAAAQSAPPPPEPTAAELIAGRLRDIDPHRTTPIEALQLLAELCAAAKGA